MNGSLNCLYNEALVVNKRIQDVNSVLKKVHSHPTRLSTVEVFNCIVDVNNNILREMLTKQHDEYLSLLKQVEDKIKKILNEDTK
jgi:hypothetical protein